MAKPKPKKKPKRVKGDILGVAEYLEANGWRVLVIGGSSIEQDLGAPKFNYRLVVRFTGAKKTPVKNILKDIK